MGFLDEIMFASGVLAAIGIFFSYRWIYKSFFSGDEGEPAQNDGPEGFEDGSGSLPRRNI